MLKLAAALLAAFCVGLSVATYSETTAKYYVDFSGASYCSGTLGNGVEKWDCRACKAHPGVNATTVYKKGTNANGFVAYVPERNQVMVAFAGTDPLSIKNWIDDIDTVFTSFPACSGCKVHKGFYDTYMGVADQTRAAVAHYKSMYPSAALTVTGHSLGAAMAAHAAMDLHGQGYSVSEVYTFGQPRFGNDAARQYLQSVVPSSSLFRLTHDHDPVPHLPLESWGFHHPATEVFYKSTSAYVCDNSGEDPKCSNQFLLDLNVLDHLSYVGFDFTANYLSCKL